MADDFALPGLSDADLQQLGDGLAGLGGADDTQYAGNYVTPQAYSDTAIAPMTGASIGKAVKLLGAAVSYYGAGALAGILPSLATVLGVQAKDLLVAFLGKKSRGRRRRGVTYRQLSNARRVYGQIGRMYHALHKGEHHRRAAPPTPYRAFKKRSR